MWDVYRLQHTNQFEIIIDFSFEKNIYHNNEMFEMI